MEVLTVLAACVVLVLVVGVLTYNGLVGARNEARNSWHQIDVQLKRRHDLIPNLIETAKGYVTHERQTLERVTEARNLAQSATGRTEQMAREGELSQALGRLLSVTEAYPDLKANTNFVALQEELTSTENRIAFARQRYNDCVMVYNNKRQGFPGVLVANRGSFAEEPHWQITDTAEREAPRVQF